jgi:hypothetical protein
MQGQKHGKANKKNVVPKMQFKNDRNVFNINT